MTKTTRIVCLCILGVVGTLCGVSTINAPITENKTEMTTPTEPHMGNTQPRLGIENNTRQTEGSLCAFEDQSTPIEGIENDTRLMRGVH